jgi:hypothetical protein
MLVAVVVGFVSSSLSSFEIIVADPIGMTLISA